jgi:hypothetical protein
MAFAILKYDLSDPEDRMDYRRAVASLDMACFIFEVLRNGKRQCEDKSVDEIWQYLWQEAEAHNINLDYITT